MVEEEEKPPELTARLISMKVFRTPPKIPAPRPTDLREQPGQLRGNDTVDGIDVNFIMFRDVTISSIDETPAWPFFPT